MIYTTNHWLQLLSLHPRFQYFEAISIYKYLLHILLSMTTYMTTRLKLAYFSTAGSLSMPNVTETFASRWMFVPFSLKKKFSLWYSREAQYTKHITAHQQVLFCRFHAVHMVQVYVGIMDSTYPEIRSSTTSYNIAGITIEQTLSVGRIKPFCWQSSFLYSPRTLHSN